MVAAETIETETIEKLREVSKKMKNDINLEKSLRAKRNYTIINLVID